MAKDPRAKAEVASLVLFYHLLEPLPGEDIPLMDEAVQQLGARFDNRDIWDFETVFFCECRNRKGCE